jgi:MinD-like ATPase involved in chromosome partitioning or flagellar assembly
VSVPVLTAIADPTLEAGLVATFGGNGHGVHVVRRCVDLADLVATASAGLARAAVLSADLRRLDGDALTRLAVAGVAVVGLVPPGDNTAEQRLRRLGVSHVLPADAPAAVVAEQVLAAVTVGVAAPVHALGDPLATLGLRSGADFFDGVDGPTETPGHEGKVIAVWGPTGAPGRTSIAVSVAAELAVLGVDTLLVDADVYGGAVAQMLGLLDEAPGLAGACRLANNGSLEPSTLAELALVVAPRLRVLTGISRAERWPELRPAALEAVLALSRGLAQVTVIDCGFALERDEELSFDTAAPRRNGATLAALEVADTVLGVAAGDPIGLQRYVRALTELADAVPTAAPRTVVNRVRPAVIGGGDAAAEIRSALARFAGVTDAHIVPMDVGAFDAAVASGRTLSEAAKNSPARSALCDLAASVVDIPATGRRHRGWRRRH